MRKVTLDAPIETLLQVAGERLNQERIRQGIKNTDLATQAGVSRATLSHLWKGEPVKTDTLLRVLRALDQLHLLGALLLLDEPTPMEKFRASTGQSQDSPQRVRTPARRTSKTDQALRKPLGPLLPEGLGRK